MFIDCDPPGATGAAMTVVCEAADGGGGGSTGSVEDLMTGPLWVVD
tara:strand:+ start:561 stop:698 length:138 start_codon:yes stop_codon:yes gene_type:complete